MTSSPNEDDTAPTTPRGLKMEGSPQLDKMDFSGPHHLQPDEGARESGSGSFPPHPTEGSNVPLHHIAVDSGSDRPGYSTRQDSTSSEDPGEESSSGGPEEARERVINIKNCPLCHRPRLSSKGEVDIVTHIALCASQDWGRMDKIVVGNFVTASQAQRKWYTKIIGKLSAGDYKLGAVSTSLLPLVFQRLSTICIELREHHRPEPNDRPAGGREDASVCEAGDQAAIQRGQVSDGGE